MQATRHGYGVPAFASTHCTYQEGTARLSWPGFPLYLGENSEEVERSSRSRVRTGVDGNERDDVTVPRLMNIVVRLLVSTTSRTIDTDTHTQHHRY